MHRRFRHVRYRLSILCVILTGTLLSCAVPVAPTGGPADTRPPQIVESTPEPNTVNFDGEAIRLVFSRYVDQGSFQRAMSFTPAFDVQPRVRWRGRRVDIQFQEPLRPNTTYILTLDTGLRAMQGPALTIPVTLAFSTGPVIDEGVISGVIVDPVRRRPVQGMDVFAYILADTTRPPGMEQPPQYRTQTDSEGRFVLSHLPEQPFYVAGVEDRNRNRRPDAGEAFAAPPRLAIRPVSPEARREPFLFHRATLDTIPPEVQRVRPLSSSRLAVRFGEAVQLTDLRAGPWAVREAETNREFAVSRVFQRADDPFQIFLLMEDALPASTLQVRPGAAADSAGNPVLRSWTRFEGTTQADTTAARFVAFLPAQPLGMDEETHILSPRQRPGIRLSEPLSAEAITRALSVADTNGAALPFDIFTSNNTDFQIRIEQPPAGDLLIAFDARILGGAETVERRYRYLSADETGNLAGVVQSNVAGPILVELYGERGDAAREEVTEAGADGRYDFDHLPEGTYRIRAFVDADTTGRWSGGSLLPYRTPDPYVWNQDSLRVRPRWETIADTLVIGEAAPIARVPEG